MTYKSVNDSSFTSLANKIRDKANLQNSLSVPIGMIEAIKSIKAHYKIKYGSISELSNRTSLSVTGLDFQPSHAIFMAVKLNPNTTDIVYITSFETKSGFYGYADNHYPIENNYVRFTSDSVIVSVI